MSLRLLINGITLLTECTRNTGQKSTYLKHRDKAVSDIPGESNAINVVQSYNKTSEVRQSFTLCDDPILYSNHSPECESVSE